MKKLTIKDKNKLVELCQQYVDKYDISCPEVIYGDEDVIINSYGFIQRICEIVGYKEYKDE